MSVVHFEYERRFSGRTIPCGTWRPSTESTDSIEGVTCRRCLRSTAFIIRKNMADRARRVSAKATGDEG